jgi:S-disulfanyl-L-cysteine oxidoreductase SoxD
MSSSLKFSMFKQSISLKASISTLLLAGLPWLVQAQGQEQRQGPGQAPQTKAQASGPGQAQFPGVGRAATQKEVRAWDIDVRPDFKGLPPGSGSVATGQDVWESKCASCHGFFGESNEVFTPLIGGISKADISKGRVANLLDEAYPQRTTLMKLASLSTLWDYIRRAMPWNQPKSLSNDEVYAVTAFMLNLGGIVPDSYVLSDKNIADAQKLLPNRYGMTTNHAMWPGKLSLLRSDSGKDRKPDMQGLACMKNCQPEAKISSFLPDYARDAHGNLAEQNRLVGPQRGAVTVAASASAANPIANTGGKGAVNAGASEAVSILNKQNCLACHGLETKLLGPGMQEVAKKYASQKDAVEYLAGRIKSGGSGVWGAIPMPEQALSLEDARKIANWLAMGATKP